MGAQGSAPGLNTSAMEAIVGESILGVTMNQQAVLDDDQAVLGCLINIVGFSLESGKTLLSGF